MGQSERSLTELARHVAALQDEAPEARLDHAPGRARLLAAALPGASRAGRPLAIRVAAALAAVGLIVAALIVGLGLGLRPHEPMRFALGGGEAGETGAWIAAPPAAELPIRFSDGSLLRLAPGGRARVASVSADGAEIALERGTLDLAVVHRDHARWTLHVGPFQVHVIGTRFETRWDPDTEQLSVALREGAITVSGPVVGEARAVRAGERLTISPAKRTLEVGPIDETSAPAPAEPTPSAAPPVPVPEAPSPSLPVHSPSAEPTPASPRARGSVEGSAAPPPREAPGWRALAVEARYKDALAAAELEGFDALCASAGASDLRALGDAARLGGSATRAGQAFAALRKRFPGSPEAASAAFLLGRIAQDRSRDHAAAAGWFTRYLSEQPRGEFAAEAAGRLVEAEDKMGDEAGARRAAERYLAAYPRGSHAAYARLVLARGSPSP